MELKDSSDLRFCVGMKYFMSNSVIGDVIMNSPLGLGAKFEIVPRKHARNERSDLPTRTRMVIIFVLACSHNFSRQLGVQHCELFSIRDI